VALEWIYGLIGGLLIGTAGALYLLLFGKVMGASGILSNFLTETGKKQFLSNTTIFLFGLFFAPLILSKVDFISTSISPQTNLTKNVLVIILAGLAVGVGTKMAGGCTSGHGVCGISRLSFRSILATIIFVLAGILTVSILKHWLEII
jgi:hypothetical protein